MAPSLNDNSLILNVDDSEGARYAKTRILTRAGFQVIEATNGSEALSRAKSDSPALILLDVKLPDINGFDVCRMIKEDLATQMILVLQTSASYIGTADKIRALNGGADNYLFEPIEPEELVANVKALLRLSHVERELRDVDRRKDLFLATLAHELRNPLGPIRNAVDLLRNLDPYAPAAEENARQTIIRQTDHLVRLVDDLLDVARITQGKISLHEESVELQSFMLAAIEAAMPIIERRRHTLTTHLPEQSVWLRGDGIRLAQIVGNLLNNAAKFTPPGGEIGLTAQLQGGAVIIRVEDNGIGIATESIASIFDMFAQAQHAPDRVQDGLGIGLSLVKSLVELHGGSVTVRSRGIGQGSVFEVQLPIKPSEAISSAPGTVHHRTWQKRRVLVVDDNVDAAEMICALLELNGHTVEKGHTAAQAVELASRFQPDTVILDIGLPDMSGYEAAAQLQMLPGMQDAILIALTGYGQDTDRKRAFNAGFAHHLVKPVTFETLMAAVDYQKH